MKTWPAIVVLGLFFFFSVIFLCLFALLSAEELAGPPVVESLVDTAPITALLPEADPGRGEALVDSLGCVTCHVAATNMHIAPPFEGLAQRAATRVEGYAAEVYVIESILAPQVYLAEDYSATMPQNFRERLSDAEIADIVAYLLTDNES